MTEKETELLQKELKIYKKLYVGLECGINNICLQNAHGGLSLNQVNLTKAILFDTTQKLKEFNVQHPDHLIQF